MVGGFWLVVGNGLLRAGCWLLNFGCWLFVVWWVAVVVVVLFSCRCCFAFACDPTHLFLAVCVLLFFLAAVAPKWKKTFEN